MKRRGAKKVLAMVIGAGLLAWIGSGKGLKPLAATANALSNPFVSAFTDTGRSIGNFFATVGSIKDLSARNVQLEREIARLKELLAQDAELRAENARLTKQLGFSRPDDAKLVPAQVTAYQPDNFRQFITIAGGSRQGIKTGQAVVADGVLVGSVVEVMPDSAKVFLVSDPNFRVNGLVQESRATGTVHGQIGSGLIMEKIAQSDQIKPGDTILTSGLGGELPKGIIIGRVESVNQKDNAVFQTALINTGLNLQRLELVFVVVP